MKKAFRTILVGSVTSVSLFLVILGMVSFLPSGIGLTAAYLWVAPALLLQGRAPGEAASDTGVGPPDLTTWFICFLFWAAAGGLFYLTAFRMLTWRRSRITMTT